MHTHNEREAKLSNRLRFAVILTALILLGELAGGYLANSLALLSDAGHVFTDLLALLLSWVGVRQATRPASQRMTFGYHRIGILIAITNALTLIAIALFIFYEAYRRLQAPPEVESVLMLTVAFLGLLGNLCIAFLLRPWQQENLNVRSAFLHVAGDTLASVGVILGGAIIFFSGWFWVDPALSVLIGLIIAFGSWQIIREGLAIFLEASPPHLDFSELVRAMMGIPGIKDVHDLHVWSISHGMHALSCHILIEDLPISQSSDILARLNEVLSRRFRIEHSTVQFECEGCDYNGLYCTFSAQDGISGPSREAPRKPEIATR